MIENRDIYRRLQKILRCPESYLLRLENDTEFLLLTSEEWMKTLCQEGVIPEMFETHPEFSNFEIESLLSDRSFSSPNWRLWTLKLPSPNSITTKVQFNSKSKQKQDIPLTLSEVLHGKDQSYFDNTWKIPSKWISFMKNIEKNDNEESKNQTINVLKNIYGTDFLVINKESKGTKILREEPTKDNITQRQHICKVKCIILHSELTFIVFKYHKTSVSHLLKYSPSILSEQTLKSLFIFYQILHILESYPIFNSNIWLSNFKIDESLYVQYDPSLSLNNSNISHSPEEQECRRREENIPYIPINNVEEATRLWCDSNLSNFEYLMILNNAAGRKFGQPNNHPVLPWVCDFTSIDGGMRDLGKSKFRITKGDPALDYNYANASHHVTEVLSDITYYAYKARVTDKDVLCKYVRSGWVPEEYPSTIQRMMSWSPDEAIPEFYTEPSIFKSIHSDLPDLGIPGWVDSAEEFCSWHMSRLESQQVSSQLHSWIDLTFGYKLSGSAAVRNKNVCLSLSDNHADIRDHGVVQLFHLPHPQKINPTSYSKPDWAEKITTPSDVVYLDEISEDESDQSASLDLKSKIILPEDCNPICALTDLENIETRTNVPRTSSRLEIPEESQNTGELEKNGNNNRLQLVGCLLVELFASKKMVNVLKSCPFEQRCEGARQHIKHLPVALRKAATLLLDNDGGDNRVDTSDLLNPLVSPFQFPDHFGPLAQTLFLVNDTRENEDELSGEFCVTVISRILFPLLPTMSDECVEILVPILSTLLGSSNTAVLSAWVLFDPISSVLGQTVTEDKLLRDIASLYDNGTTTAKHVKLYHRTFLLSLILRFGTGVFLGKFINPLIEAVGGYKELDWDAVRQGLEDTLNLESNSEAAGESMSAGSERLISQVSADQQSLAGDTFSEGEVFAFDGLDDSNVSKDKGSMDVVSGVLDSVAQKLNLSRRHSEESLNEILNIEATTTVLDNAEERSNEANISLVAAESTMWLAQRLGPVLACKHLSRNLLRMLALCFYGPEGVQATDKPHPDQMIRVSCSRVSGDVAAEPVLECLCQLVGLYGDSLVVVQYLPHCADLVSRAKRRISSTLESGILSAVTVAHVAVPLLSDSVLMNELPHTLLPHILVPILQLATSRRVHFLSGPRSRTVLIYKVLDALYLVGVRVGEEMARIHLTPLALGLFSSFDKVEKTETEMEAEGSDQALLQLRDILTPALAFNAYICFKQLLGGTHLESNLANLPLVKKLLRQHSRVIVKPQHRPASLQGLQHHSEGGEVSYGASSGQSGNMIVVSSQSSQDTVEHNAHAHMIHKPAVNSGRHLKGNWLAYWEHELGKDERDNSFNFKQIKLQSFLGHTGGVKSLHVMDNENSFLSASKDKTVRLWSVRNIGEGDSQVSAQAIFSGHKKSVFYVSYLHGPGHAVSCDGSLLIWDPFMLSVVSECELTKVSFCAVTAVTDPGHVIVGAATDGTVRLLDTRVSGSSAAELKVSLGAAGLVRSMAVNGSGQTIAVGHSSGYISILDIRTGKVKFGYKAHDGEVLTLTNINKNFVSTSLDQLASGWSWEGRQTASLRSLPEPVHCVSSFHQCQVVMGTSANRLIVQSSVETDCPSSVHKLKADMIRGNLTQMAALTLNKQLLLATDSGTIHLVC